MQPALRSMPSRLSRLLSSRPFEIKSGDKSYFIHGGILTPAQSESLRRTETGGIADIIDLSGWGSDTVGLFAEFLYTGDYDPDTIADVEDAGGRGEVDLLDTLRSLVDHEPVGDRVTNQLLLHAKVYALAKYKNVEALWVMALERLKTALENIDVRSLALDVIGLLEYVYSDIGPEEPMRDLVLTFAADNFEKLMSRGEMGFLLGGGCDLTVELLEKVALRLGSFGGSSGVRDGYCDTGDMKDLRKRSAELEKQVRESGMQVRGLEKQLRESEAQVRGLENQVQEFEVQVQDLEEQMQELEATNAEVWQSQISGAERVQELEVVNEELLQQLEEKSKSIEAILWGDNTNESETGQIRKIRQLKYDNTEKTRLLETANAQVLDLKAKVERLEYKQKWLEAVNAEKLRQPEGTDENAKMWLAEARLEAKLGWFMAACPEKVQEYEDSFPGL